MQEIEFKSIISFEFISGTNIMTINFDDIATILKNDDIYATVSTYKGLIWSGFSYMEKQHAKSRYPGTGFAAAFASGASKYIVWANDLSSIRSQRANEIFNIVSIEASAVYSDSMKLTLTGYRNSMKTYELTTTLFCATLQSIELCWTDIDTLRFQPNVTTPQSRQKDALHFVLTSLTATASSI